MQNPGNFLICSCLSLVLPTPAQQPSTTSTPGQFIPEHLITVMQCMHDEHVHFLKPLGRDPCAYFKEKDEEQILRALGPDVVVCPFCSRRCRSHQKIVSHCKKHHCKSLALKCNSCTKSVWRLLCPEDSHKASLQYWEGP